LAKLGQTQLGQLQLGHVASGQHTPAPGARAYAPAATPIHENFAETLPVFASVSEAVRTLKPAQPLHLRHPAALAAAAQSFVQGLQGKTYYAVKCNPSPWVLQTLANNGVSHFDVASTAEIELVRANVPHGKMAFMHPIKSREAIARAYFEFGVRDFAVDTFEEMHKVLAATTQDGAAATDLGIIVRLATPNPHAAQKLSDKFGCTPAQAVQLLRDAEPVAKRVGLAFHVGSQNTDASIYSLALDMVSQIVADAGVDLDVLDIGGGFPAQYDDGPVPAFQSMLPAINSRIATLKLPKTCEVWAEPGRCLVAAAESVVCRIELRKDNALYINDGLYGSLFDAGYFNQKFPATAVRVGRKLGAATAPYKLFGPTCDSVDVLPGPYLLPADLREGDFIIFAQHGAYGRALASRFNGFYSDDQAIIDEAATARTPSRRRAKTEPTAQ
jgi:ornithine decarboxylase